MPSLFAQLSDKATDPAAWSTLAQAVGVGGLFGIVLLLMFAGGGWYVLRATVGENGFVRDFVVTIRARVTSFFDALDKSLQRLEDSSASESRSREEIRAAGMQFARGMAAIGGATGADVRDQAATIQALLGRTDAATAAR